MVRDREKFNHGAITFTRATDALSVFTLEALPRNGHNLVTAESPAGRRREATASVRPGLHL
jgi:hypothetical protein